MILYSVCQKYRFLYLHIIFHGSSYYRYADYFFLFGLDIPFLIFLYQNVFFPFRTLSSFWSARIIFIKLFVIRLFVSSAQPLVRSRLKQIIILGVWYITILVCIVFSLFRGGGDSGTKEHTKTKKKCILKCERNVFTLWYML